MRALPALILGSLLAAIGIAFQYSASLASGPEFHLLQIRMLLPAAVAAIAAFGIPYPWLVRRSWVFYGGLLVLLVLVPFIAPVTNGSRRWIPIAGFSFQPSEPMKVACILALARVLRYRRDWSEPRTLIAPALLIAAPVALVFAQPDLGTAILFIPVGFAMLVVAGLERRHIAGIVAVGGIVAIVGYATLLAPYQQERVLSTVLRSRLTPIERQREGYQLEQALRSIGNGGVLGRGFGEGDQNRLDRLPHRHNDFVFSVIAEETGLAGATALLIVLLLAVVSLFAVAWTTREPAGRLIAVGAGVLFAAQSIIHVGVNLGVVPTTGMTLPFVSYGGSSLLTFAALFGLVANVAKRRVPVLDGDTTKEQIERLRTVT